MTLRRALFLVPLALAPLAALQCELPVTGELAIGNRDAAGDVTEPTDTSPPADVVTPTDAGASDAAVDQDASPIADASDAADVIDAADAGPIVGPVTTLVTQGGSDPRSLTLHDIYVYWANYHGGAQGEVVRMHKDGSSRVTQATASGPFGVAVSLDRLFFSAKTGGEIYRCSPGSSGCTGTTPISPTGVNASSPGPMEWTDPTKSDGVRLYWADDTKLWQQDRDGNNEDSFSISGVVSFRVDSDRVYCITDDAVVSVARDFNSQQTMTSGHANLQGIAIYEGTVSTSTFVTRGGSSVADTGKVMRVDKVPFTSNYTVTTIADNQAFPMGIAVDPNGTYVYWVDNRGGTIWRARADATGTPRLVVDGQDHPREIVVDGTSVFWSTNDAILRADLVSP